MVNGTWGDWEDKSECTANCEEEGFKEQIRICSEPQQGGQECTRLDDTQTTNENRNETRQASCVSTTPCQGKDQLQTF